VVEPEALSVDECWQRVGDNVVGRLGFDVGRGPRIHPMNYAVDGRTVVLRTSRNSELALFAELFADGSRLAFEVDQIDHRRHHGWSVLMDGHLAPLAPGQGHAPAAPHPWPDGERDVLIRFMPVTVTGRTLGDVDTRPPSAL
jgi:nitroimidazol reductase NimA-like FMN-containing flavoprotein (pyridoxamine 5'-phosphate oxidase superfamily)